VKDFIPTAKALNGPATCQNPECRKALKPGKSRTQAKEYCGDRCQYRAARLRGGEVGPARVLVGVLDAQRVPASYREPAKSWTLRLACGHVVSRPARAGRTAPGQVECEDCKGATP